MAPQIDAMVERGLLTADEAEHHPARPHAARGRHGRSADPYRQGAAAELGADARLLLCSDGVQSLSAAQIAAAAAKPVDGLIERRAGHGQGASGQRHGGEAGARVMSKGVGGDRGDAGTGRREPARGIAAVVKPDGTVRGLLG